MQVMAKAKRFPHRKSLPDWFVKHIRSGSHGAVNYNQLCQTLAENTGYKVSSEAVKKYLSGNRVMALVKASA